MPRFCANLSLLFTEFDFPERFAAAAAAGFRAVECQFPYAWPAERLAAALAENGLQMVLHNLPPGDWEAGERGIACLPGREEEFGEGLETAVETAHTLGCRQLNCLAGIPPAGVPAARVHKTLVANLRHAAARLEQEGIRLLVEALNDRDVPGFYLRRTAEAVSLIEEVGHPNLFLLYDVYHMQTMEGNLIRTLRANLGRIGHIQIADPPERNEPGTGEVNFRNLFREIDAAGYEGWIGCEYRPLRDTLSSLGWLREIGA
ncbi:MAG: hydroxypyruvate isomerase [Desulfobacterales bacterium]